VRVGRADVHARRNDLRLLWRADRQFEHALGRRGPLPLLLRRLRRRSRRRWRKTKRARLDGRHSTGAAPPRYDALRCTVDALPSHAALPRRRRRRGLTPSGQQVRQHSSPLRYLANKSRLAALIGVFAAHDSLLEVSAVESTPSRCRLRRVALLAHGAGLLPARLGGHLRGGRRFAVNLWLLLLAGRRVSPPSRRLRLPTLRLPLRHAPPPPLTLRWRLVSLLLPLLSLLLLLLRCRPITARLHLLLLLLQGYPTRDRPLRGSRAIAQRTFPRRRPLRHGRRDGPDKKITPPAHRPRRACPRPP
jgi:hypothetical protein